MVERAARFSSDAQNETTPYGVLTLLGRHVRSIPGVSRLYPIGSWHLPSAVNKHAAYLEGKTLFFYNTDMQAYGADYFKGFDEHGSNFVQDYARRSSAPFTLTHAMRKLRPTGPDRWLIQALRRHGIRDTFNCFYRSWALIFASPLVLDDLDELSEDYWRLSKLALAAVARIERLVPHPERHELKARDLSPREEAVLRLLADGNTAAEAARKLGLSHKTVQFHRGNAIKKLGAKNVTQAAVMAFRVGIIK